MPVLLAAYLRTGLEQTRDMAFRDSLPLPVYHNRRIDSHQVFAGSTQRGKSSMGWFYGFKLHSLINEEGALWAAHFRPATGMIEYPYRTWPKDYGASCLVIVAISVKNYTNACNKQAYRWLPSSNTTGKQAHAALVAYTWQERKLSLHLAREEQALLAEVP